MPDDKRCLICGEKQFIPVFTCTDHLVSHREFRIDRCSSCGFLITDNAPGPDVISSYYDSPEYISHTGSSRTFTEFLYGIARNLMLSKKSRLIRKLSGIKKGAILDIGAGTGHFVKKMKNCGWQSTGVEINESARNYALKINGVELLPSFEEIRSSGETFDVVTLWHVLEHIHEPLLKLNEIAGKIKQDGILVIALPNPTSADAWFYKDKWAAFDVPRHLWHFCPENILTLVTQLGFNSITTRRMPFDSFYISVLSEKQSGSSWPLIKGMARGKLFWLKSLVNKERSSSLIYLFRKI